jgi:hypothetical protein
MELGARRVGLPGGKHVAFSLALYGRAQQAAPLRGKLKCFGECQGASSIHEELLSIISEHWQVPRYVSPPMIRGVADCEIVRAGRDAGGTKATP